MLPIEDGTQSVKLARKCSPAWIENPSGNFLGMTPALATKQQQRTHSNHLTHTEIMSLGVLDRLLHEGRHISTCCPSESCCFPMTTTTLAANKHVASFIEDAGVRFKDLLPCAFGPFGPLRHCFEIKLGEVPITRQDLGKGCQEGAVFAAAHPILSHKAV